MHSRPAPRIAMYTQISSELYRRVHGEHFSSCTRIGMYTESQRQVSSRYCCVRGDSQDPIILSANSPRRVPYPYRYTLASYYSCTRREASRTLHVLACTPTFKMITVAVRKRARTP